MKLALIGSNGAIGQPLALLLQTSNYVHDLVLHDVTDAHGVATDLSHIDVRCKISSASSAEQAVDGADIIAVTAGFARKPGMTRDDLFNTNAKIIQEISEKVCKTNPSAMLAIITNPINATVPIACETFMKNGVNDTKKIFGVTSLDIMRANKFIGDSIGKDPQTIFCPVVGGHQGTSIVPLMSQASATDKSEVLINSLASDEERKKLVNKVQNAGTEVVEAKKNGSASLSMAYAAYMFLCNLIKAKSGTEIKEYSFIDLRNFDTPYGPYFSVPMIINQNGAKEVLPINEPFSREEDELSEAVKEISKSVEKAQRFVRQV